MIISSPHPNAYELQWPDGRYAGISNLRQLRPHRVTQLRQPRSSDATSSRSSEELSTQLTEENFVAGCTKEQNSPIKCGQKSRKPRQRHQTWSKLRKSESHIKLQDYSKTAGEISSSLTAERVERSLSEESEREDNPEQITPFEERLVQDIACLLERWNTALKRHKRRKIERRSQEEPYAESSISILSSSAYSTRLQSEIDQAIEDYDRALAFHNKYSPFTEKPVSLERSESTRTDEGLNSTAKRKKMENLEREQLEQIDSLQALREIYRYWFYRNEEAATRLKATKKLLIDDIITLRQNTLEMEEIDRQFRPHGTSLHDSSLAESERTQQSSSSMQQPSALTTTEADKAEEVHSPQTRPKDLDQQTPLATLMQQSEQESSGREPKDLLGKSKSRAELYDGDQPPIPGPSTQNTQPKRSIPQWSSDSSEEEIRPHRPRVTELLPNITRRQRFGNPRDSLTRFRNPKTGRFMSEAERASIGPPGRKSRPENLPRRLDESLVESDPGCYNVRSCLRTVRLLDDFLAYYKCFLCFYLVLRCAVFDDDHVDIRFVTCFCLFPVVLNDFVCTCTLPAF